MLSKLTSKINNAFYSIIMKPFVQRILLPFGDEIRPERWIFILGCYNSGTTLLASIIRHHPAIEGLPNEGAFLTDALPYPERFGWPRMWSECQEEISIAPDDQTAKRASRIKRQWSLWLSKNPVNVVEKSISNVARIDFLNDSFSPAYFIYIVRNGYAVAKGIQKKANLKRWNSPYRKSGYPIELCANQWRVSDQWCNAAQKRIDQFLIVSYEDFTKNPTETINRIMTFLGLEAMSPKLINRNWPIHGVLSPIRNMNVDHLKDLTRREIHKINKIAKQELIKYGYYIEL